MPDATDGMLLDTCAVVAYLRHQLDFSEFTKAGSPVYVPLIALGELYQGAEKSRRPEQNRRLIDEVFENASLLVPDIAAAHHYGKIAANLSRTGQLITTNDIWIAAIAFAGNLTVIERDAHFHRIAGLRVIRG